MVHWIIYNKKGERYILKDLGIRTTPFGEIAREELLSNKRNFWTKTKRGDDVLLIKSNFFDKYKKLKRGAQPINIKDCGIILAETLVGKDSICFDCGSGMGGLCTFLARYTKKVYTMDNNPRHAKDVAKNIEMLNVKNIIQLEGNVYEGIPISKKISFDLVTIDVPEPEKTVDVVKPYLHPGGFFVAYCPQVLQAHNVVEKLKQEHFEIQNMQEVIIRKWTSGDKILRPEHIALVHTGFLVFARKTI